MKAVLSTKHLAKKLNELLSDEYETVESVSVKGGDLEINARNKSVILDCVYPQGEKGTINQVDCRWDWLKDLVNKVDKQPFVLEIGHKTLSAKFSF